MDSFDQQIIHQFATSQVELADRIVMSVFRTKRGGKRSYHFGGFRGCIEDVNRHLSALANAVAADERDLFADYVSAVCGAMVSRGISVNLLADLLEMTRKCVPDILPEATAARAVEFIEAVLPVLHEPSDPPTWIADDKPLSETARACLDALLAGDCERAEACILRGLEQGIEMEALYLDVLQSCQRELGRLWQMNRISVAKEHYCSACTRSIMAQLISSSPKPEPNGRWAVATCVVGELHDLGLAMVCDFLRMRGWNTQYVGANLPPEEIIGALVERKATLLAVSATMVWHIRWVHAVVELVRASQVAGEVRVLVGGAPFTLAPQLWMKMNADGTAPDARSAAELAEQLVALDSLRKP